MKKICFFSTSRSELDLIIPLVKILQKKFNTFFILSGDHFNNNINKIVYNLKKEGIVKIFKIKIDNKVNSNFDFANYVGVGICSFSSFLKKINPDILVILGDRIETLSFAIPGLILNKHIVHIHGGEKTKNSIDDVIRNILTKISNTHLASSEEHKNRIIQMGENPKNVYNIGSFGVTNSSTMKYLSRKEIEKKYNFKFKKKNLLVVFHPETRISVKQTVKNFRILLKSLKKINEKDTLLIFNKPNHDPGSSEILNEIKLFCKNNHNTIYVANFGQKNFFSFLKICNALIGNSSSGMIETPYLNKYSINLGLRQKGRKIEKTIFSVEKYETKKIIKSIKKVLSLKSETKIKKKYSINSYYAADKIISKIKLKENLFKEFYDIGFNK